MYTVDGIYLNVVDCTVAGVLPLDVVYVTLSLLCLPSQGCRIDLGSWGNHRVGSAICRESVMVASGIVHISAGIS